MKIQDEKKTLEDRLHFLEEFGREQCNNTTTGADFTDDLDRNGKRSSLFDEVQELLDMREKKPSTTEATMLKLCRYSKYKVNIALLDDAACDIKQRI